MKFRTRTIGLLAAVMGMALCGLIYLQYVLLSNAVELKEQAFRQNVNAAMNAITQKLQTRETVANVFRYIAPDQPRHQITVKVTSDSVFTRDLSPEPIPTAPDDFGTTRTMIRLKRPPIRFEGNTLLYSLPEPQHVTLRLYNEAGRQDTVLVDEFQQAGDYSLAIDREQFRNGEFFCKFGTESAAVVMRMSYDGAVGIVSDVETQEKRRAFVGRVIENLTISEAQPIERRIDPAILDTVVTTSLRESGIDIPAAYGVLNARSDSLRIVEPAGMAREVMSSEFRVPLFPFDFFASRTQLILYFPEQRLYLLKEIGPLLGLTVLFMAAIIFCFAATLRMIVRQQQFSGRLVDFINNMTHEFKTPVSTIAVAAETMMRPEILDQPEKLVRYGTVIHDENQRMKQHIDRILQMAVLEEGDFELKKMPVDVHEILGKVIEPLHLRVEAREGTIDCNFTAGRSVITGDPVHLANIFHNVLDNASKYSPEKPSISIETLNEGDTIVVRVADRGVGIGKEHLKKVFEKYYRVPTGNIHNVKGFGLGLSYVKLIADAHGARAAIDSEAGRGTTVTFTFPLADGEKGEP